MAVVASRRHSDEALASKSLDLLGQLLGLRVAVAQLALPSIAPQRRRAAQQRPRPTWIK